MTSLIDGSGQVHAGAQLDAQPPAHAELGTPPSLCSTGVRARVPPRPAPAGPRTVQRSPRSRAAGPPRPRAAIGEAAGAGVGRGGGRSARMGGAAAGCGVEHATRSPARASAGALAGCAPMGVADVASRHRSTIDVCYSCELRPRDGRSWWSPMVVPNLCPTAKRKLARKWAASGPKPGPYISFVELGPPRGCGCWRPPAAPPDRRRTFNDGFLAKARVWSAHVLRQGRRLRSSAHRAIESQAWCREFRSLHTHTHTH